PDGPHGPSAVVDPDAFVWHDAPWRGVRRGGVGVYELHVGSFTPPGTVWGGVGGLPGPRRLGGAALGRVPGAGAAGGVGGGGGGGYDGVDLFAPHSGYGGPEGLRRLVDAAHAEGLGVLLDVVYNHLGPDGNYLRAFSPDYFTERHQTPWGDALNFDGP